MPRKSFRYLVKSLLGRESVKLALRPLVRWSAMSRPEPGFSIILGVPWHLRHLLPVNLRFISGVDLQGLLDLHVVFDRRDRPQLEVVREEARRRFPHLPIVFHHYPDAAGRIIERTNVSTFYNSMNCATALARVRTKYAVIHDFDLFPLTASYFRDVVERMRAEDLRFCGLERTHFDGLTEEDNVLGTWCLGVDVEWLRGQYQPLDIFHKVRRLHGHWTTLDPFSAIQLETPQRALVASIDGSACCHVGNLCATYLRYRSGQRVRFAWKLHYLWYLEALNGDDRLRGITEAMDASDDGVLRLGDGFEEDFKTVDPTCANVLRHELKTMDAFLHGDCRPHVAEYVESFRDFLMRAAVGSTRP